MLPKLGKPCSEEAYGHVGRSLKHPPQRAMWWDPRPQGAILEGHWPTPPDTRLQSHERHRPESSGSLAPRFLTCGN